MESFRPTSDGGLRPNNPQAAANLARYVTGDPHPSPAAVQAAYGGSRAVEAVMRDEAKRS